MMTKMETLVYIDTHSHHTMHEQFNASLLAMCAQVCERVEYRSGRSSRQRVYKLLDHDTDCRRKIHWKHIRVWGGGFSRTANIMRLLFSAFQNVRTVVCASSKQTLVFNYNNLFSLFAVNWLCRILKRRVVIFCHGEMEMILESNGSGGFFVRIQRRLAKRFFLSPRRRSRLHFAVMGDSILGHIRAAVAPGLADRFVSVDHSYIFGSARPKTRPGSPLEIGTVGVLTHAKGYDTLCAIAKRLKTAEGIRLSVTGRIFADAAQLESLGVDLPENKGARPLEDEEFAERIDRLDYILFLYPPDSYRMIASGAVMDAVEKARPILSLRNDYFTYLFSKYGAFGLLAEDTEELIGMIERIGRGELECPTVDFDALRSKMSPVSLSAGLRSALDTIKSRS